MSYIIQGFNRYNKLKYNAYWNNAHLDSRFRMTDDLLDDAVNHLNDCRKNPTRGLLARKKFRTNNYPDCYKRNLNDLYKNEAVKTADNAFKEKFSSLYPKSGKVRKFLIKSESIVLDYVKPVKKNFRRTLFKMFGKI